MPTIDPGDDDAIQYDDTPAYAASGPTVHENVAQAAATITRDNYSWTGTLGKSATVTYGFRASTPSYSVAGEPVQTTFSRFTTAQIDAVVQIVATWSDVANITLTRVGTGNAGNAAYTDAATILLGNYSSTTDGAGAFTYYPSLGGTAASSRAGDLFDNAAYSTNTSPATGSYGWITLIHELGHALGLEHPGAYNASPTGVITYAANASYIEDSRQYTVMSYFDAAETGANHRTTAGLQYAVTPLLDDIAALQRLYGARTTTRTGDTVYGFHSNADRDAFRLSSASDQRVMTIYDSGGRDTIDMSGYSTNQVINLNPGTFSSTGSLTQNLSIAMGTTIEAAIGGAGNDTFVVNAVDDTIDGGGGFNTVVFAGYRVQYDIRLAGSTVVVTDADPTRNGSDTLTNIRSLQFLDQVVDTATLSTDPERALFDRGYYLSHNLDVYAAKLDPYAHYLLYGYKEGRNPNAFFDVSYYKAHNSDVVGAGDDALKQYAQSGWKQGRDPSLMFSDAGYLTANPDVANAKLDPLYHFLTYGGGEGRMTFLSGGSAAADPLVDAAFYDKQLGATLIPSGVAAAQQAAWSYDTAGWKAGLNPNQWFDTNYYLAHNADVAAAHIDPLAHYETYGWKEGRDPSASFSTGQYFSANLDVFKAQIDPLLHYVQYGQTEGRAMAPA